MSCAGFGFCMFVRSVESVLLPPQSGPVSDADLLPSEMEAALSVNLRLPPPPRWEAYMFFAQCFAKPLCSFLLFFTSRLFARGCYPPSPYATGRLPGVAICQRALPVGRIISSPTNNHFISSKPWLSDARCEYSNITVAICVQALACLFHKLLHSYIFSRERENDKFPEKP